VRAEPNDLADCVSGYAARLHAASGPGHQVASPLGAWLLLALAAPASTGPGRNTLTGVLGCDPETAARWAGELLARPNPAVASAVAVWTAAAAGRDEHLRDWQQGLPEPVSRGPLPDQAGLDRWAREHTFGMIDRFPVSFDPGLLLVLASALATRVSWLVPFAAVPATRLGPASSWSTRLTRVLATPPGSRGHEQFIAVTDDAGDVAVHVATAREGLAVVSLAARPEVPQQTVLAAAHRIGCQYVAGTPLPRRDPAGLPPGEGPLWLVREERSPGGPDCTAVLPAWSAVSGHDLAAPGLGFDAAVPALLSGPWQARQSAMARYSRTGFEAAAVTAAAVTLSARLPVTRQVAELRFGHPYAVVAVATGPVTADQDRPHRDPWHGVPVFSAWVSEPDDTGDPEDSRGPGEPGDPDVTPGLRL
jgi:hypothetical protein